MRTFATTLGLSVALSAFAAEAGAGVKLDEEKITTIAAPSIGGWVLAPDGSTLIVSSTTTAEIVFIDTVAGTELLRASVDFQPTALAIRGTSLYVAGKGSSMLYVLDSATGKQKKEIKIPGEKLLKLALHPTSGPLFATNDSDAILAINPETNKVTKTEAEGNFIAIDPADDDVLFAGTQKPIRDTLLLSRGPGNSVRVGVSKAKGNSTLVKYNFKKEMRAVSVNEHAAVNATNLVVSPDGKKVAIVGGGGSVGASGKRAYAIDVYGINDLASPLGQVETGAYPANIAFHPTLDLGIAEKRGGELFLFNSKSYANLATWQAAPGTSDAETHLLTFAAHGTKLVYYRPGPKVAARAPKATKSKKAAAAEAHSGLILIPLVLGDDEKAKMEKATAAPVK